MLLVRHAFAGDRTAWTDDDRLRPLDDRGRREAKGLVDLLARFRIEVVLTSPFVRCLQTVGPLASARGLEIEIREELGEERQMTEGIPLLHELDERDVVVCGHGGLETAVPDAPQWKKGAVFVLGPGLELLEVLEPPTRRRGGR